MQEMLPRLGDKYDLEVEVISKSRAEYQSPEYLKSGLPPAAAAMVEEEVVARGAEITEEKVEATIRRHLGLTELPQETKKGFLGRIFNR